MEDVPSHIEEAIRITKPSIPAVDALGNGTINIELLL